MGHDRLSARGLNPRRNAHIARHAPTRAKLFADIDSSQRDLGGWVADAKELVARELQLPAGYRL